MVNNKTKEYELIGSTEMACKFRDYRVHKDSIETILALPSEKKNALFLLGIFPESWKDATNLEESA